MGLLAFTLTLALAALATAQSGQVPFETSQELSFKPNVHYGLCLVEFLPMEGTAQQQWMTEAEKLELKAQGRDFMDITDTPHLGSSPKQHFSYPPPNSTLVRPVFPHLSTAELKANLWHFTSYHNRAWDSDTGKESSEWLFAKILTYTAELASEELKAMIDVEAVQHPFKQISIIARITPPGAVDSDPATILGAHIDSLNYGNFSARAPGAGDDGSGTVTILEAFRGLLVANYIPASPLEFHFYAGEEGGLRGSLAIASRYEAEEKAVRGMIQFDMTAWLKAGTREEIAVIGTLTDTALSDLLVLLIERYIEIPWVRDVYARGGTDHISWTRAGYQSCHPLEAQLKNTNPHIHTADDRIDVSPEFSFDHMLDFSKLAVAFAIEMTSY
ncbi:peptidase [Roridomyces roridus]|uniref:Peptide hydrolase n=1 Tax=Roridomyces roridus TaxID=1738132 RepID=A0AAD7FXW3_9AGAR|nr:peptidase [Roridomyces roridus]